MPLFAHEETPVVLVPPCWPRVKPPRKPKPDSQLPSTGWVIAMLVACTAPVSSALPCALAQTPTFTAAAVAVFVVLILVLAARVTVLFVVVGALELGLELEPLPKPVKSIEATTREEPDAETTLPMAVSASRPPRALPPLGAPEGLAPVGKPPLGAPDGRVPPPNCPPAPPPAPPPHVPLVGVVTATVAAVKEVAAADGLADEPEDEPEAVVAPIAVTQSPALIALAARLTSAVNFVEEDQVTAV
jgi:hypothetical protein